MPKKLIFCIFFYFGGKKFRKMPKNQLSNRKFKIARPVSFHQLLKLLKINWAQNFDFPLKKLIFGHIFFFSVPIFTAFVHLWCTVELDFGSQICFFPTQLDVDFSLIAKNLTLGEEPGSEVGFANASLRLV